MTDDAPAERLFAEVLERAPAEWPAALERACAAHPSLEPQLRELYSVLTQAGLTRSRALSHQLGDYRLRECIGIGGMGAVFRAEQVSLGRDVAVKVIRPEGRFFPDHRERFQREVQALAKLKHPNIVTVLGGGDIEGVPYFAMELVSGCTLAEALGRLADQAPDARSGADLGRAIGADASLYQGSWIMTCFRIVERVAEALQHAHEAGVVHRDVKPSNVMLGRRGEVLLIDFGLARLSDNHGLTRSQAQLGSLPYLAPEVVVAGGREADAQCDVYGLGVTLYEMLASRPPFTGSNAFELGTAIAAGAALPPRSLNRSIHHDAESICLKAIDPDRRRRYSSARDFAKDLRRFQDGLPVQARHPGRVAQLARRVRRRPLPTLAVAASVVAVLGTLVVHSYRGAAQASQLRLSLQNLEERLRKLWNLGAAYVRSNTSSDHAAWAVEYARTFAELGFPLGNLRQQDSFAQRHRALVAERDPAADTLLRGLYDFELRLARAGCHLADALAKGRKITLPSTWDANRRDDTMRSVEEMLAKRGDLVRMWPAVTALIEELERDVAMRRVHAAWLAWKLDGEPSPLQRLAAESDLPARAASRLGEACLEALGPEAAIPVLERAVEFDKGDFRAHFTLGSCHRRLVRTKSSLPDLEAAVLHYEIATSIDPKSAWAWTNLGEAISACVDLDPTRLRPDEVAVVQRWRAVATPRMIAAQRRAIAANDQILAPFVNLANCLPPSDPERRQLLDRALELDPHDLAALRSAAYHAELTNDPERRVHFERRILASSPNDLASLLAFARTMLDLAMPEGRTVPVSASGRKLLSEAIQELQRAVQIAPEEPYVRELLFCCHAQLGDLDPALDCLETALAARRARFAASRPTSAAVPGDAGRIADVLKVMGALEQHASARFTARWNAARAEAERLRAAHSTTR